MSMYFQLKILKD